jgi:hypothetical protein
MKRTICTALLGAALLAAAPCLAEDLSDQQAPDEHASARTEHQRQVLRDRILNHVPQFSMAGTLERKGAKWSVNGEAFEINDDTMIQGEMKPGAEAEIRGFTSAADPKLANQVVVFDRAPVSHHAEPSAPELPPANGRPAVER